MLKSILLTLTSIFILTSCSDEQDDNKSSTGASRLQVQAEGGAVVFKVLGGLTPISGPALPDNLALHNMPAVDGKFLGLDSFSVVDNVPVIPPGDPSGTPLSSSSFITYNSPGSDFTSNYKNYVATWLGGEALVFPATHDKNLLANYPAARKVAISAQPFLIKNGSFSLDLFFPKDQNVYVALYFYDGISTVNQVLAKLSLEEQQEFLTNFEYSKKITIIPDILKESFVPGFMAVSDDFDPKDLSNSVSLGIRYNDGVFDATGALPSPTEITSVLFTSSNNYKQLLSGAMLVGGAFANDDGMLSVSAVHDETIAELSKGERADITLHYSYKSSSSKKFALNYVQVVIPKLTPAFQKLDAAGQPLYIQNLLWSSAGTSKTSNRWRCVVSSLLGRSTTFQVDLKKGANAAATFDPSGLITNFSAADFRQGNPNLADGVCGAKNWQLLDELGFYHARKLDANNNPHLLRNTAHYLLKTGANSYQIKSYDVNNMLQEPSDNSVVTGRALAVAGSDHAPVSRSYQIDASRANLDLGPVPESVATAITEVEGEIFFAANNGNDNIGRVKTQDFSQVSYDQVSRLGHISALASANGRLYLAGSNSAFSACGASSEQTGQILVFDQPENQLQSQASRVFAGSDSQKQISKLSFGLVNIADIELIRPSQIVFDDQYLYVADPCNKAVRRISLQTFDGGAKRQVVNIVKTAGTDLSLRREQPTALALVAGDLYIGYYALGSIDIIRQVKNLAPDTQPAVAEHFVGERVSNDNARSHDGFGSDSNLGGITHFTVKGGNIYWLQTHDNPQVIQEGQLMVASAAGSYIALNVDQTFGKRSALHYSSITDKFFAFTVPVANFNSQPALLSAFLYRF